MIYVMQQQTTMKYRAQAAEIRNTGFVVVDFGANRWDMPKHLWGNGGHHTNMVRTIFRVFVSLFWDVVVFFDIA
jgi:hypothetical protein